MWTSFLWLVMGTPTATARCSFAVESPRLPLGTIYIFLPPPSAAEALDGVMHKVLPISPARVPGKQDAGLLCMCGTAVVCTGQTQIQTAWGSSQVGAVVHSGWCYAASLTHHFYGGHI